MVEYGIISDINYKTGRAKVLLDGSGIVTDWLSLPHGINANIHYNLKQQVSILMAENGEDGVILNTEPGGNILPPSWSDDSHEGYIFSDGSTVLYNAVTHKLKITIAYTGEIELICSKLIVSGDVVAGNISLKNHAHTATPELMAGATPVTGTITIAKP